MNDKIKINLQIADSNYPLTINREEEEIVRDKMFFLVQNRGWRG